MITLTANELHDNIEENIINPNINKEIEQLLRSRNRWRKISNISEASGNVLIASATILAFANGIYNCNSSLAFSAGCVNIASIAILRFSDYASGESTKRNNSLNELLIRVRVQPMPSPSLLPMQISNTPEYYY